MTDTWPGRAWLPLEEEQGDDQSPNCPSDHDEEISSTQCRMPRRRDEDVLERVSEVLDRED